MTVMLSYGQYSMRIFQSTFGLRFEFYKFLLLISKLKLIFFIATGEIFGRAKSVEYDLIESRENLKY